VKRLLPYITARASTPQSASVPARHRWKAPGHCARQHVLRRSAEHLHHTVCFELRFTHMLNQCFTMTRQHIHALSLYFVFYNFTCIPQTRACACLWRARHQRTAVGYALETWWARLTSWPRSPKVQVSLASQSRKKSGM